MADDKLAKLELVCIEQQRTIDDMARKLNIVTTMLDDLVQVDRAHEAQTLLIKNGSGGTLELDEGDDGDGISSSTRHFCCFFCQ